MGKLALDRSSLAIGVVIGAVLAPLAAVSTAIGTWMATRMEILPTTSGWCACALLASSAAWAAVTSGTCGRVPIHDVDDLAARNAAAFPFVSTDHEDVALQGVDNWIATHVGNESRHQADHVTTLDVETALARQLTRPWMGFENEPSHRQAIIALLALRATGQKGPDRYAVLRDKLARAAKAAGGQEHEVRAAVSAAALGALDGFATGPGEAWVSRLAEGHHWSETVIMSLLDVARIEGVLPETEFGWLMVADRPLALALNSVGRPSFLIEALGAACHWHEELRAGTPLTEPAVQAGVRGIRAELDRRRHSVP